jgi:quercetin dioxygenase-like cupin family protein
MSNAFGQRCSGTEMEGWMEVVGRPESADLEALAPTNYIGPAHAQALATPFGEELAVRFVRLEPGARSRPHVSSSGRLIHVVAGEAVVADEQERIVVGRGDTVIVGPGEWHWHGGLPHVAAVLLVVDRPDDVSWNVAERDWSIGYDRPTTEEGPAT